MNKEQDNLLRALQTLLLDGNIGRQEEIIQALESKGFIVNQSKVSRLLRKLGAAKTTASDGSIVYRLPKEPAPSLSAKPKDLVQHIQANESLIIVQTAPGGAGLVARLLDHHAKSLAILGSIAGDDAIFIAPESTQSIDKTKEKIERFLQQG
mgnify:CR=1 FL=1